jgi:DNA-binding NarL/FixJ family response regulator
MSGELHRTRELRVLVATRPEWSRIGTGLGRAVARVGRARGLPELYAAAVRDRPDVVVVDTGLDPLSLPALCAAVADLHGPRVLLAADRDDALLYRAVLQGATSVVPLGATAAELDAALLAAARGEAFLPAGVAARLLLDLEAFAGRHADPIDPPPTLTDRELAICEQLADRMALADVAAAHGMHHRLITRQLGFAVRKLHESYQLDPDLFDEEFERTHLDELP